MRPRGERRDAMTTENPEGRERKRARQAIRQGIGNGLLAYYRSIEALPLPDRISSLLQKLKDPAGGQESSCGPGT